MYAIIQTAGHQLKVSPGGIALVAGSVAEPGAKVTLEEVLFVEKDGGEMLAGAPFVANAKIHAVVEGEARGPIIVRQRGRRFRAGLNAGLGKDDTIFAKIEGRVRFEDHGARGRIISILPLES